MLRNAGILDLNFIHKLILSGSQKGHFSPEFYINQAANDGLKKNLQSILNDQKRLDVDVKAYALIAENDGKPTSFMIISALEGSKGNEIWMMGTDPQYQGKGIASYFLDNVLKQFKMGNRAVFARCEPVSEVMFKLLTKKDFKHLETGESGTRILAYNL
ncbi:GNAT family N-acetyltransferase [Acinetobacter guillouiae]|uniref:GNAT family N-acetyltransferase n=1 Tax=Acinetobacter guillouiae TaxID=106649 RepID=UPI003AF7E07E